MNKRLGLSVGLMVLAVALLAGCAGKAPRLGKVETPEAVTYFDQAGEAYYDGNYTETEALLQKAVRAGSPEASMFLADFYEYDYVELSPVVKAKTIRKLISDAAESGYPQAITQMAQMYRNGQYVDQDDAKATQWLLKAGEAGDVGAMETLADGYRGLCGCGVNCPCGPDCPAKANLWPVERDMDKAVFWYGRMVEAGNIYTAYLLGDIYTEGLEVPVNYAEAYKWFKLGADMDEYCSMNGLANLYLVGQGVPKDYAMARELYIRSGELGNSVADYNLAELQLYAPAPWGNTREAVKFIKAHAESGDSYAQLTLGEMYETGRGVSRDYKQALKWYKRAADAGQSEAMNALGGMYRQGLGVVVDYAEAENYFTQTISYFNNWGHYGLGQLYLNGQGVSPDRAKAAEHFLTAANFGHQGAMLELGKLYEQDGNRAEAVRWYRAAANHNINDVPRSAYTREYDSAPLAAKARVELSRLGESL